MMHAADTNSASSALPPLNGRQLESVFPFFLLISGSLKILATGKSLNHYCREVTAGQSFTEAFDIKSPANCQTAEDFRRQSHQLCLVTHRSTGHLLRGQILPLDGGDFYFLGSPWLTLPDQVEKKGLTFTDFSISDPVIDLLQVIQTANTSNLELKQLNQILTEKNAALKNAEILLKKREEETRKLAIIASRTSNAVVLTDAKGYIEWVNEGFTRQTGFNPEEVIGKKPGQILQGPETNPETVAYMHKMLEQETGFKTEILNYTKSGEKYWLAIEVQPIRDLSGKLINFMAIETDISERRRFEADLYNARIKAESANQAKSLFLANVSHELRTPLHLMLGTTELLLGARWGELGEEVKSQLTKIKANGKQLLDLIVKVLELTRLESDIKPVRAEPTDIRSVIQNTLKMFSDPIGEKQLSISEHYSLTDHPFLMDQDKISQVLANLISNAIKFSPTKGQIQILARLDETSHELVLTVADQGIGISPEDQTRIFRPFEQIDQKLNREHSGTGLGLAICQKLVQLHGGRIEVESHLGQGSSFHVFIPPIICQKRTYHEFGEAGYPKKQTFAGS